MNPNEQKAADLLATKLWFNGTNDMANALSAAGLLVTPDHEAALAACERVAAFENDAPQPVCNMALLACSAVGRRSLDAKKPKERWTLEARASLEACKDGVTMWCFPHDAEPEARAYVARKNAEEAAR